MYELYKNNILIAKSSTINQFIKITDLDIQTLNSMQLQNGTVLGYSIKYVSNGKRG